MSSEQLTTAEDVVDLNTEGLMDTPEQTAESSSEEPCNNYLDTIAVKETEASDDQNDEQAEEAEDDDFGSFSDASFDDFEEPVPAQSMEPLTTHPRAQFPQSVFSDPEQLFSKLQELSNSAFPNSLPEFIAPQNMSILNNRSEHLLERLTSKIYLKPYNWQKSSLRKELLITLGLPDTGDQPEHRVNRFDIEQYVIKPCEELNINTDECTKLVDETDFLLDEFTNRLEETSTLSKLADDELDDVISRYVRELETVEKLLSIWNNEKLRLQEDNNTFESVVENLVGHTQRIRREETFKSLKKEKEKSKGIGSIFRRKKK